MYDPPDGPPIVIVEAPDPTPPESRTACANCGAAHHTWQCPAIRAALFAPEPPHAHDAGVTIGYPITQDNGELEYPGYIGETLIGFYPTVRAADVALHNVTMVWRSA